MDNEQQVKYICDIVEVCMLPTLIDDVGSVPFLENHFHTYHELLKNELPNFFDLWQKNHNILLKSTDSTHQIARANVTILLCELTAPLAIYKLKRAENRLLLNANKLLRDLVLAYNNDIDKHIFNYYQRKLHKDSWKRELGAAHGFERYLEYRYAMSDTRCEMNKNMLAFGLAVGLNVRECHEYSYKQLGVNIFKLILKYGMASDIQELNIHSVVFEHTFNDTYNMEQLDGIINVWDCLRLCMDHITHINPFVWNQCDDSFQRLIQNVTLSTGSQTSIALIEIITKMGYHFSINRSEIDKVLFDDTVDINTCRTVCSKISAYTNFRWAKDILEMLTIESEKLLYDAYVCENLLCPMHRCYLVCIFPIPIQVLHLLLKDFYSKFMTVLLECVTKYEKTAPAILLLVKQFTETFLCHLESHTNVPSNLLEFVNAFKHVQHTLRT